MSTTFLPFAFVPLVGLVFPRITISALFLYIEKESIMLMTFFRKSTLDNFRKEKVNLIRS
nr:photosystem I subunit VIII [Dinophyceae sp. MRD-151]